MLNQKKPIFLKYTTLFQKFSSNCTKYFLQGHDLETKESWVKQKTWFMFIIINMAKWYHSLTKHHKMEWNKTNSLWHVLPSLFPCILCPFIIVLTQASNIQWPPQGTPNGTTKSSLCCTLTLPTACDAFSADSVIYEYKYLNGINFNTASFISLK